MMVGPYAETVESGHQWLGRVPAHWRVSPLGVHFDERSETVSDEDYVPLSVTKNGVVPQMANVAKTDNGGKRKLVLAGDFAINSRSDRKGAAGLSLLDGSTSVVYTVLVPRSTIDGRFVHHLLRSQAFQEEFYRWGNGIVADLWSTRYSSMKLIPLAVPPLDEQRAIADYLDRETARIDTLIDEQQRLIDLLRERRRAVVDAAFSSLGEPRVQLRRYVTFLTSGSRGWGDYYADAGDRFLRIGNLPRADLTIRGDIQFVDLPESVTEGSRTILHEGDVLFSITAYLGSVAVVEGDWVGAYVSQHVALCRLDQERVDSRYIGWFMLSTSGWDQLNEGAAGGTKVQLALDDIRGLRVPTPPSLDEQRSIAACLDERTSRIDMLIAETERFIELSRERRSALITAAMTGQIDVRELA